MITGNDVYQVLSALVPIYVAVILAYASVRWFKIFSPPQCAGINSLVAVFCIPFLSFHFISGSNLYTMNFKFLAADCLQKLVVLAVLLLSHAFFSAAVPIEWVITLYSMATLPNTLIIGVPLLTAMYGDASATLMVQIVVLQSVVWFTLLIFLFEYRGAMIFIRQQFPDSADRIASLGVESDVVSMSGREDLEAETDVSQDGKIHVTIKRPSMSSSSGLRMTSHYDDDYNNYLMTPRASNLTGVDMSTPRGSSFNGQPENFPNRQDMMMNLGRSVSTNSTYQPRVLGMEFLPGAGKDLHMFGWSPSRIKPLPEIVISKGSTDLGHAREMTGELKGSDNDNAIKEKESDMGDEEQGQNGNNKSNRPPWTVLIKLILIMVWRRLIRNPNTYGSVLGLIWALISFRFNVKMPLIIDKSITVISNSSLGMSVFSLGLFMALQPKLLVCGKKLALMALLVRFLVAPIVIAVTSVVIGVRGDLLRILIIQAALPQAIVSFVFAKAYNVHPDILSAGVIWGMLVALPVTIVYYIILGLV